eukprot:EG_transcript_14776
MHVFFTPRQGKLFLTDIRPGVLGEGSAESLKNHNHLFPIGFVKTIISLKTKYNKTSPITRNGFHDNFPLPGLKEQSILTKESKVSKQRVEPIHVAPRRNALDAGLVFETSFRLNP